MKRLSPLKTYILALGWELKSANGGAETPISALRAWKATSGREAEGTGVPQGTSKPEATGLHLHWCTRGAQTRAAVQRLEGQPATRRFLAQAGWAWRGARIPVAGQCAHLTIRRQAQADTQGREGGAKRSGAGATCGPWAAGNAGCESAVVERKASRRSSSRRGCERRRADRTARSLLWRGTSQWGLVATPAPILRSTRRVNSAAICRTGPHGRQPPANSLTKPANVFTHCCGGT